jgi:hypothetical protein
MSFREQQLPLLLQQHLIPDLANLINSYFDYSSDFDVAMHELAKGKMIECSSNEMRARIWKDLELQKRSFHRRVLAFDDIRLLNAPNGPTLAHVAKWIASKWILEEDVLERYDNLTTWCTVGLQRSELESLFDEGRSQDEIHAQLITSDRYAPVLEYVAIRTPIIEIKLSK